MGARPAFEHRFQRRNLAYAVSNIGNGGTNVLPLPLGLFDVQALVFLMSNFVCLDVETGDFSEHGDEAIQKLPIEILR